MLIGYVRTSTTEQEAGFEAQLRELKAFGVETLYKEQVSSIAKREQLDRALGALREGDSLVVCKLDRLARSVKHLGVILDAVERSGAGLVVLSMGGQQLDSSTATGKLMLHVMVSVAQFEREMMLERQREGIAKAKAAGKFKGRQPTARAKSEAVLKLVAAGVPKTQVCLDLGISRASLYRILADSRRV